jgi:putative polyketide hydroxylase
LISVTDINGTLVPRGDGRWLMAVQFVPDRGEDFTRDHCRDLIRRGAGRADLRVDIVDARPWEAAAAVADRYKEGRVLLVGDSAHVMPPTGGFGGNTGIQDAYNLAWKLDAVVNGTAAPDLLETYDAERRPIADRTVAQSLARLQAWFTDPGRRLPPPERIRDDNAVIFGYRYPAGAFVDDGRNDTDEVFEDPRNPSGRPGSRAPHLVATDGGAPVSTIDLFADRWVLISGREGNSWSDYVRHSSAARALGVEWYGMQPAGNLEDVEDRFSSAYGVGPTDAVLVRPDGFIAWRHATAADGARALDDALERLWIRTAVNTGGQVQ